MGDNAATSAVPNVVILKNIKLKPLMDSKIISKLKQNKIKVIPIPKSFINHIGKPPGSLLDSSTVVRHKEKKTDILDSPSAKSPESTKKYQPEKPSFPPYTQKSKRFKKYKKVKLFDEQTAPEWHKVTNKLVTKPIITSNLPKVFQEFPIFGCPKNYADLKNFQRKACQEFVGLSDKEYAEELAFCSSSFLLTGQELVINSHLPTIGNSSLLQWDDPDSRLISPNLRSEHGTVKLPKNVKLRTHNKIRERSSGEIKLRFARKLKYRGLQLLTLKKQDITIVSDLADNIETQSQESLEPPDLQPGEDLLYRVRIYRPFVFTRQGGVNNIRGRHTVFSCDVVLTGRQPLRALRERVACRNDRDLRLDVSQHPRLTPPATAKESFPSNFMFINNVFYVDTRPGCRDMSAGVRAFAAQRGLGPFAVRDLDVLLRDVPLRLAHPEVYVHQGNCEHIFQFSEIRLLNNVDPLHLSSYPCHTAVSQNQMLYCNNCAEFAARWIVTHSQRVPFDPAFFCETCFHSYMYIDGKKVENFKAYLYKGNEINILRPDLEMEEKIDSGSVQNKIFIHYS